MLFNTHWTPEEAKLMYDSHRRRLAKALPRIDCRPPAINVRNTMGIARLHQDAISYQRIMKDNMNLLKGVNQNTFMEAEVKTFGQRSCPTVNRSHCSVMSQRVSEIQKQNFVIGSRLLQVRSVLDTWNKSASATNQKKEEEFSLPVKMLEKYDDIKVPKSTALQQKLFRPQIYLDLVVQGMHPLSRVVVQLYTEAAPQVVLELVQVCSEKCKEKLNFVKIFPKLWMEGEIPLDRLSPMIHSKLEYDKRALKHDGSSGIFSFPHYAVDGFRHGVLSFSISFRPLSTLNGNRVAFGRIIKGRAGFETLSEFGLKNGKPIYKIFVKDCGIL